MFDLIRIPTHEEVCEALGCSMEEFRALPPEDRWDLIEALMNKEVA